MTDVQAGSTKASRLFLYGGIFWSLLAALAFWAYYSGSAPFDTLGIPISQLVLAAIFFFIWVVRSRG
jgi:hypothetical protein